jgi:hypothetical protein
MSTILTDDAMMQALDAMQIEPIGASLSFTDRLARENGWSRDFAARVFAEYRRFLYLAATSGTAVTPSDEVDQAWHLHLAYSRHYWDVLCSTILKRPLHHGPTAGGDAEDSRYQRQYADTKMLYQQTFGAAPPADIWPDAERRFGAAFQRVEMGRHWLVPKRIAYPLAALPLLAACSVATKSADGAIAGVIAILVVLANLWNLGSSPNQKKKSDGSGCGGGSCSSGDSGCGGGCGGGCGS